MAVARFGGLLPLLGLAVPVVGALASLYLMTNSAYTKAVALEQRVAVLEASNHSQELELRVVCNDLVEVETQFRASDQVRNLMHVDSLRIEAMLWHKSFNAEFPVSNAYLPTIAREKPEPCR